MSHPVISLPPGSLEEISRGVGHVCELCERERVRGVPRFRRCRNAATREVLDWMGHCIYVCEPHFRRQAS
jgi:hypothetical protein